MVQETKIPDPKLVGWIFLKFVGWYNSELINSRNFLDIPVGLSVGTSNISRPLRISVLNLPTLTSRDGG